MVFCTRRHRRIGFIRIHRDTRHPEVFALSAPGSEIGYTPSPAGPVAGQATGIRPGSSPANRLLMQLADDESTRRELPDE
jgi:hypothetical protein